MTMSLKPGCKINLFLRILGLRADGYHELSTMFLPLPEPGDELLVERAPGAGLEFTCSDPTLAGPSNLVVRAYEAFAQATGQRPGLRVHLDKRAPIGAGLGGGSADAAAMLSLLHEISGSLSREELMALAARLGADVPFFLMGVPALAGGIGERLTPWDVDMAGMCLLLACPAVHVSTAWAYRTWDERPQAALTQQAEMVMDPFRPAAEVLANDFETVVLPAFPELRALKQELLRGGALQAVMSGSGSAFFALYDDPRTARMAQAALNGRMTARLFMY